MNPLNVYPLALIEYIWYTRLFMRQKIQFDESKAKKYRKRLEVLAFKSADPIVFHKSWGDQQLRSGGWIIVSLTENGEPSGDIYGCDAKVFNETYEPVPDKTPHRFRKTELICAYQPGHAFEVDTVLADGHIEVKGAHSDMSDAWVVQAPNGEVYIIQDAKFQNMYVQTSE